MKQYAIIGKPVEHSLAGDWFTRFFKDNSIDADFRMIEPKPNDMKFFRKWILENNFDGLLVTIPFKMDVMQYLYYADEHAAAIGAANIIAARNEKLYGFNVDYAAFESELTRLRPDGCKKAIVMGSGGAANAVIYALKRLRIPVIKVSRHQRANVVLYDQLKEQDMEEVDLIINATPLGMKPFEDEFPPINYTWLKHDTLAYDLIYNPAETLFLKKCTENGCQAENGRGMVEFVYEQALKIWGL